jgi:hypothetical protein
MHFWVELFFSQGGAKELLLKRPAEWLWLPLPE